MMRRASEMIGMRIISQTSGASLATIYDLIFDPGARRVSAALISRGGWFAELYAILWSSVISIGDVVLVHGADPCRAMQGDRELSNLLSRGVPMTGTAIFNEEGYRVGTVGDVFINTAGEMLGFEVGRGFLNLAQGKFLPAAQIITIGQDAVIVAPGELMPLSEAREERERLADQRAGEPLELRRVESNGHLPGREGRG